MSNSPALEEPAAVGFVGLGNMGSALAANLVASGLTVVCTDKAGPARAPQGARFVASVGAVCEEAEVVVLSLPDGTVSEAVAREIVATPARRTRFVIDTSTTGLAAAAAVDKVLAAAGIGYVDAPVSGGPAGARARTLAVMYAGSDEACAAVQPVLAGLSDRRHRVGDRPGLGQAVKLANNFLSATALAATSEAISFATSVGLDLATVLAVLNGSSGQNTATSDKFPNHVVTQRYASGFSNLLMAKDLGLYLDAVRSSGTAAAVGEVTVGVWERFADAEPGVDFTRIYPFVHDWR